MMRSFTHLLDVSSRKVNGVMLLESVGDKTVRASKPEVVSFRSLVSDHGEIQQANLSAQKPQTSQFPTAVR